MSALLAFELSPDPCTLAVQAEGESAHQRAFQGERGRALLHEMDLLLQEAQVERTDLRGIVVGIGPGSYTGLRIACTAARSLAYALDLPCGGISSFHAAIAASQGGKTHVVLDAYRGEVYYAMGESNDGRVQMHQEARVCQIAELSDPLADAQQVLCDPRLSEKLAPYAPQPYAPQAKSLLQLALDAGVRFDGSGFDQLAEAEPLYLRAAAFKPGS